MVAEKHDEEKLLSENTHLHAEVTKLRGELIKLKMRLIKYEDTNKVLPTLSTCLGIAEF